MSKETIIILHTFITYACAKNLVVNNTRNAQDFMDQVVDKTLDKLVSRASAFSIQCAYLDQAALAKTQVDKSFSTSLASADQYIIPRGVTSFLAPPRSTLNMYGIGSSPVAKLAIAVADATDCGSQMRDVSMRSTLSEMLSNMDEPTKERFWKVQREVMVGTENPAIAERFQEGDVSSMKSTISGMLANVDEETRKRVWKVRKQILLKAENLAGITAPLGFFDPLGFSTNVSTGKLLFYREAELKHGRIAMLASLGFLVGEQYHPLFGGGIDLPSYISFTDTSLHNFWPAVVTAIAVPEMFSVFSYNQPPSGSTNNAKSHVEWASIRSNRYYPLYLGFDPLQLKNMYTAELINGRLAMIAVAGMIAQELVTGHKIF